MTWTHAFASGPAVVTLWAQDAGNVRAIWSSAMAAGDQQSVVDPDTGAQFQLSVSADGVVTLERSDGVFSGIYEVDVAIPAGTSARISDVNTSASATDIWTSGYCDVNDNVLGEQLTQGTPCTPNPSIFIDTLVHSDSASITTPSIGVYLEYPG